MVQRGLVDQKYEQLVQDALGSWAHVVLLNIDKHTYITTEVYDDIIRALKPVPSKPGVNCFYTFVRKLESLESILIKMGVPIYYRRQVFSRLRLGIITKVNRSRGALKKGKHKTKTRAYLPAKIVCCTPEEHAIEHCDDCVKHTRVIKCMRYYMVWLSCRGYKDPMVNEGF